VLLPALARGLPYAGGADRGRGRRQRVRAARTTVDARDEIAHALQLANAIYTEQLGLRLDSGCRVSCTRCKQSHFVCIMYKLYYSL
jgi:hypothetical protein